jgi:hypothetical protein
VTLSDDPAFLERLRKGDKEACAICVHEHSTNVYNLALQLAGSEPAPGDVQARLYKVLNLENLVGE